MSEAIDRAFELRRAALESALGTKLRSIRRVAGGDINEAVIAETDLGPVFVKWNDRDLPRQFESEARGLDALREARDPDLCHVPAPLGFCDAKGSSFLALEYVRAGRKRDDYDELLGRALAGIHRRSSSQGYGFQLDGCCGATPQPNGFLRSWREFYRERRLLHQARLARSRGMERADVAVLEQVAARLEAILPEDAEPPALVHGDLWAGNVLVASDGLPAFIDPAAYFADREAEFGMMRLFGSFSERTYAAYRESYPWRDGFESRVDLYRLYHLLNHFNLFGGGYGAQAIHLARRLSN